VRFAIGHVRLAIGDWRCEIFDVRFGIFDVKCEMKEFSPPIGGDTEGEVRIDDWRLAICDGNLEIVPSIKKFAGKR
jgi:hypothetical protein